MNFFETWFKFGLVPALALTALPYIVSLREGISADEAKVAIQSATVVVGNQQILSNEPEK